MSPAAHRHVRTELLTLRLLGPVADDAVAGAGHLKMQGAGPPAVGVEDGVQGEVAPVEVNPGGHRQLPVLAGNLELDVVAVAVEQERLLARPAPGDPACP